jgi:uncharacterized protein YlxW (UPF0749 family)
VATRLAFGLTVGLLAVILVTAAQADTTAADPRTGRRVELVELIRAEQNRTRELEATVQTLAEQVAAFEGRGTAGAKRFRRVNRRIDHVVASAGLTAVRGPGLRAVLTDSTLAAAPTGNLNDLVIHEQDLQAVINGLWAGGAEAVSVNGQRVLATTAIRCVGNTLLLHGGVYSPPYIIDAVGDPVALRAELARDPAVARFSAAAREFKLGFAVTDETLQIPSFEGATALKVAQTAGGGNP